MHNGPLGVGQLSLGSVDAMTGDPEHRRYANECPSCPRSSSKLLLGKTEVLLTWGVKVLDLIRDDHGYTPNAGSKTSRKGPSRLILGIV